jgi:SAM-dependent methyltransferase
MNETAKTRRLFSPRELALLSGRGIDIGCGTEPIVPNAQPFDVQDGDANDITRFVEGPFDFVYSSHCLEHMKDARAAVREWWKLVKPGGHLVVIVPDEDLYEQGFWPSRFNRDHKWTFTIAKSTSWSPVSINLLDLVQDLPGAVVQDIRLQDSAYRRELQSHGPASIRASDALRRWMHRRARGVFGQKNKQDAPVETAHRAGRPVDQTQYKDVVAQILCIVRKDPRRA